MSRDLSECLDEDAVLAFARGSLLRDRRREAIEHVDVCEVCRSLAAALAREVAPGDLRAADEAKHVVEGQGGGDEANDAADEAESGDRPIDRNQSPAPARIANRYELLAAIGHGATATVYRAHDETLGSDVALKLVRRTSRSRPSKTFTHEHEVGRRIRHPNVCRLHDAGSTEDVDFITMELVEGQTLAQLIATGELPIARALEILDAIAAGLAAAHAQRIVHRDLKPANVMIEAGTGRVVLMDFGFATILRAQESRRLVGTPAYWSPEQARGEGATPASDVFSFGVLAYRLLAARDFKLSDHDPWSRVPKACRSAVARCLSASPSARFADARAVREAFRAATRRRRGRALLPIVGAAAVAVAALALTWSPPRAPPTAEPAAEQAIVGLPTVLAVVNATPVAAMTAQSVRPAAISPRTSATRGASVHPPPKTLRAAPPVRPPSASSSASVASSASPEGDLLYAE